MLLAFNTLIKKFVIALKVLLGNNELIHFLFGSLESELVELLESDSFD
jgi:hypothetical protein